MDKEGLYPFQIALIEIANKIKEAFSSLYQFEERIQEVQVEIDKKKLMRATWSIQRDTRVASQVINNKPRRLIKKII
jgi:hypothetical protein